MSDVKSAFPQKALGELREALLTWYAHTKRPLPWRTESSVYRTVVSEFMCQQTQIATVLPYFDRWVDAFPDFQALADASEEVVLKHWAGLGYYARARNLHKLAQALCKREAMPEKSADWVQLPGIGAYTASAICSIQFGEAVAVVDGNVIRVLARIYGLDTTFPHAQAAAKAVQPLANAFLNPLAPGDHNQALMELGALVCSKHKPACLLCPAKAHCRSLRDGVAAELPRIERKATVQRTVHRVWAVRDGCIALEKQAAGSRRLAHLHELPLVPGSEPPAGAHLLARKKRGISNQIIEESIWVFEKPLEVLAASAGEIVWQRFDALSDLPVSGPHQRWIKELWDGAD